MDENRREELYALLSKRKRSIKEIESTVADGGVTEVEIFLPSFFELYPKAESAYKEANENDQLNILIACEKVLTKGDDTELYGLLRKTKRQRLVIDLTTDEDAIAPPGSFKWQADMGDTWIDYDPQISQQLEDARFAGRLVVELSLYGNPYKIDLDRKIQINLASGTARPIRSLPLL